MGNIQCERYNSNCLQDMSSCTFSCERLCRFLMSYVFKNNAEHSEGDSIHLFDLSSHYYNEPTSSSTEDCDNVCQNYNNCSDEIQAGVNLGSNEHYEPTTKHRVMKHGNPSDLLDGSSLHMWSSNVGMVSFRVKTQR